MRLLADGWTDRGRGSVHGRLHHDEASGEVRSFSFLSRPGADSLQRLRRHALPPLRNHVGRLHAVHRR